MVGGPDDKNSEDKGPEENAAPSSPPEVEAEQVEAEIVDAEFTDAQPEPEEETSSEGAATSERPQSPVLRPAVIAPLALVIILAAGLAVWRAFPPKKAEPDAPAPAVETQSAPGVEDAVVDEGDADAGGAAAPAPIETDESTPPPTEEAPAGALPPPDPSKILNSQPADLKAATDAIEGLQNGEATRSLPPAPPPGGANDEIQRAAKDALRTFGPEAEPEVEAPAFEIAPSETEETFPEEPTAEEPSLEGAATPSSIDEPFARLQEQAEADVAAEEASLAAAAGSRASAPPAEAAKISNDVAALKELFSTQTDRLSSELSAAREESAALGREVASLRESLAEATTARSNRENDDIAALREELEKIRTDREQASAAKAAAASMALLALQQKLASGAPYQAELERLTGFAPRAAGLGVLSAHAEAGVPTLGALKTRFGPAIRKTLAADRASRAEGFFGGLLARLEGLVSVRPARPQQGDSALAVISRAEASLAADDLAGAVRELDGLDGPAREAIAPWLEDARARAGAEGALAALSGALAGEYGG